MPGLLNDPQQMRNLLYHTANRRRIRAFDVVVELLQAERPNNLLVGFRRADGAAIQLNFDLIVGHVLPRLQTYMRSGKMPRISLVNFVVPR